MLLMPPPSGSFWAAKQHPDGPYAVRNLEWIYGLPSNTKEQQGMADQGSLLVIRSVQLLGRVIQSQRRRRVPDIGSPYRFGIAGGGRGLGASRICGTRIPTSCLCPKACEYGRMKDGAAGCKDSHAAEVGGKQAGLSLRVVSGRPRDSAAFKRRLFITQPPFGQVSGWR